MTTPSRTRDYRIGFRTTTETGKLIEKAVAVSCRSLTEFAEETLVVAARRVLADQDRFTLTEERLAAWEAINKRPARELPGLRALMNRPSPFED